MSACVVVGADSNALVAAHYLARAGHRVVVLDERPAPDLDVGEAAWLPPRIARDLGIGRHGAGAARAATWLSIPLEAGGRLELTADVAATSSAIGKVSARDADRWPRFCEHMAHLAGLLASVYDAPPPDPLSAQWGGLANLGALGLRARRLGREDLYELMRMLPMPAADFLDEWFACDALKAALGAAGVLNVQLGPRSGGTAFNLLHHHVGSDVGVFRPPVSEVGRVLRTRPGVELRTHAKVERILVRGGAAAGVALAKGDEIAADVVVSGLGARRTLLELADPGGFDPQLVHAVRHIRSRGVTLTLTAALTRAPGFDRLAVVPSLDALERAYDASKYGRASDVPFVEARVAVRDADGTGGHRVEVHVQYAPYVLRDGVWDAERGGRLARRALDLLADHAPPVRDAVIERVLTPVDMERLLGWPQGQAQYAELALDQLLWARPVPALAHYRTPLRGLYLCGPDMHPGAGVAGAAGAHAAAAVLRDLKRDRGR